MPAFTLRHRTLMASLSRALRLMAAIGADEAQSTLEGAVAELKKGLAVSADLIERLRSIPVPTERTRQVERVNDRLDRAAQGVAGERRDLDAGDYDAAGSYMGVLTNYADTDDLYLSLDVSECAPNAK